MRCLYLLSLRTLHGVCGAAVGRKNEKRIQFIFYFTFCVYVCSLAHSTRFWLICRLRSWFIIRASAPEDVGGAAAAACGCVGDQHEASERQKAAMSASKCVCVREHEHERVRVRVLSLSLSQEGSLLQKKCRRDGEHEQAMKKCESNLHSLIQPRSRSLCAGFGLWCTQHCTHNDSVWEQYATVAKLSIRQLLYRVADCNSMQPLNTQRILHSSTVFSKQRSHSRCWLILHCYFGLELSFNMCDDVSKLL